MYEEGWVPDALETQEYWVLEEIKEIRPAYFIYVKKIQYGDPTINEPFIKNIEYEKSIESYTRTYNFTFLHKTELQQMKAMVQNSSCEIIKSNEEDGFFDVGEGLYELTFKVPANIDISDIWIEYLNIRNCYDMECMPDDYDKLIKYSKPFIDDTTKKEVA